MADIERLSILLTTSDDSGSGTDGDVYVGIAGREFYLDTNADDFERGAQRTYVVGLDANVKHAGQNDPRKPQLRVEDIDRFPVYVRFAGKARGDNWRLENVFITINDVSFPQYERRDEITMGTRATSVLHLFKHQDPIL